MDILLKVILKIRNALNSNETPRSKTKVGCVFPMVIWPEFYMGQYREDEHRKYATHFTSGTLYFRNAEKQLLYSVKLSHKYYMKCMTYFAYIDWSRQTDEWCFLFLRATIELSALIKNSNPEKSKNKFLESFRPLITVLPALERLTCKFQFCSN